MANVECTGRQITLKAFNGFQLVLGIGFFLYVIFHIVYATRALRLLEGVPVKYTFIVTFILSFMMVVGGIYGVFVSCIGKRLLLISYTSYCVLIFVFIGFNIYEGYYLMENYAPLLKYMVKEVGKERQYAVRIMDMLQGTFYCCGFSGSGDYAPALLPRSCCSPLKSKCVPKLAYPPCGALLLGNLKEMGMILFYGGISYCVLLFLIIIVALCIIKDTY